MAQTGIIGSLRDFVMSIFQFFYNIFASIVNLFAQTIKGLGEATGGIAKFLVGNILIIGVLAVAFFGYLQYQRQQGRTVKVGDKKLN